MKLMAELQCKKAAWRRWRHGRAMTERFGRDLGMGIGHSGESLTLHLSGGSVTPPARPALA